MFFHKSALLQEVTNNLNIEEGKIYIDATLGGGGHTREIIKRGGIVLGIDQDSEALKYVEENFKFEILNFKLKTVRGNFKNIKQITENNGFNNVSGILFDLGVSSYQIGDSGRGFSFKRDEPLDMRMDKNTRFTARDIVNTYTKEELEDLFLRYGEEENAAEIAKLITEERKKKPIETTKALSKITEAINNRGKIHPGTRVFQALRIEVNNELESIKLGVRDSIDLLKGKGRILVISFHSLEDRIIKQIFNSWERESFGKELTKRPIIATNDEVRSNPRARSAKLRIFEKN